jgi:two-component system, NtrC family, response regulator AtoC
MAPLRILIAENNETASYLLKEELVNEGYKADIVTNSKKTLEQIHKKNYDLLLLNVELVEYNGVKVLSEICEHSPSTQIIIVTAKPNIKEAVACLNGGAYDILTRPYEHDHLRKIIERAAERRNLVLKHKIFSSIINLEKDETIIGECDEMKNLIRLAENVAQNDTNILVTGEIGSGRKLLAKFIHKNSIRANRPFVSLNCSEIPDQMMERELFGFEKEFLSDAKFSQQGLIELLDGGVLLLEEVDQLNFAMQSKLARFIETGEFRRTSGVTNLNSSLRIIGTTCKDLTAEVARNNFRQDLLANLSKDMLHVPALRDRGGDIIMLSEYFLRAKSDVHSVKKLSSETKIELLRYDFSGNVHELKYIIERAVISAEDQTIRLKDLLIPRNMSDSTNLFGDDGKFITIEELEKVHIFNALEYYNWNREQTAHALGISIKTLYSKILYYKLKK